MSEENAIIRKGTIIALTSGSYSDWTVNAIVEALRDLSPQDLEARWGKASKTITMTSEKWYEELEREGLVKCKPSIVSLWVDADFGKPHIRDRGTRIMPDDPSIMTPELAQAELDKREAFERELRRREIEASLGKLQAWRETELTVDDGRLYADAIAPFQRARFIAWDTWDRVYVETCVGSSKTSDMAGWCMSWLVHRPGWEAAVFAVDRDQAATIIRVASGFVRRNPRLASVYGLEVGRNFIRSLKGGGSVRIESSDVASAEGLLVHAVICEQLESWPHQELWESIVARAQKRACKVLVIANAPQTEDDWAWKVRDDARQGPPWKLIQIDADDVPWYTPEKLADARRLLSRPATFARLYYNVIGTADTSLFTPAQVEAMMTLPGASERMPSTCRRCVLALDMGIHGDLAALSCVGEEMDGSQDLLNMVVWQGHGRDDPVAFVEVEDRILEWCAAYSPQAVVFDPWQFERSAQSLKAAGLRVEPFTFTSKTVNDLSNQLWRRGVDRMLHIYPNAGPSMRGTEPWDLAHEFRSAKMVEDRLGFRIEQKGHGTKDRIISLGMASLWLQQARVRMAPETVTLSELMKRLGA